MSACRMAAWRVRLGSAMVELSWGAVDVVGRPRVHGDVVHLGGGLVVEARPRHAAVEGDGGPAVVALDHAPRVVRVNPQVVVVAVRDGHVLEDLAAVVRAPQADVEHPDGLGVLRIGDDVHVVPGALAQLALLGELVPVLTAVVGAVHRALLALDDGPDAAGPGGRGRHADLAEHALGQPVLARDVLPSIAAVARAPQAAALATALQLVRPALSAPRRGVQDPRVLRVHRQVAHADALVDVEHALPRRPAIARAVDAALLAGAVRVAQRRDVDHVRVRGMDADLGDVANLGKAQMLPGRAGVGGLPHAVAVRDVAADGRLAHADVDHVRVGRGDGDGADRRALEEAVGDVLPVDAAVGGLP